jgi:hypothetical protein
LNTTNPPHQPNKKWRKGKKINQGQGENPQQLNPPVGETKTRLTKTPKGEITMDNHSKEGAIKFKPISLVNYVVNIATTPTIAPKLLITIG